jgi:ArsR family transcriptional regulator
MAEWNTASETEPVTPSWSVRASLVVEWYWALLVRPSEEEFPVRSALFAGAAPLVERIVDFWDDDDREFLELVVLAKRAGCLWENDPDRLLSGVASVIGSGEGSETLDSESPENAAAIRRRLVRLGAEPALAAAWLELMADVAATVRPSWDSEGCMAVQIAVRAQSKVTYRATSWPDVALEPGCDWGDLVPRLAQRTVDAGGEVVLVPSWLARKSFLLSLGDLVLLGVGAPRPSLPSEATRVAARRLRALADATRLAVVEQLAIRPRGVGDLARDLEVSQPTISNHVRLLREAGVVREGDRPNQRQLVVDAKGLELLLEEVRALVLGGTT